MPTKNRLRGFPKQLPEPQNYFQGIATCERPRSSNLICFLRTTRHTLQQAHFHNRSHHRHVLILVLESSGSVIVDGAEHVLQPGQAYYVKPFQFHHYLNLDADDLRWLFFTFDLDEGAGNLASISDQSLRPDPTDLSLWRTIAGCAAGLREADRTEALPVLDTLLFRLACRQQPTTPGASRNSWIAQAAARIIQSIEKGWTVEETGRKLGVSGRQLRTLFAQQMGVSIREYRANYQLHRAISLMHDPRMPMVRIAEIAGFNSQAVFNRFIKRQTGKTPGALRREMSQR